MWHFYHWGKGLKISFIFFPLKYTSIRGGGRIILKMLPTTSPKYVKRGPYFFNESEETVSKDESKTSRNNENATVGRKRGCKRNNRNNACKRNLELVMKSRLEYPNTSTYSCRPGKSSQNQLYVYHNIDKTAESPPKQRHDNIAKVVHWKLCEKCHLEKKKKEKKKKSGTNKCLTVQVKQWS